MKCCLTTNPIAMEFHTLTQQDTMKRTEFLYDPEKNIKNKKIDFYYTEKNSIVTTTITTYL